MIDNKRSKKGHRGFLPLQPLSVYPTSSSDIIRKEKYDCPVHTCAKSEQNGKFMNTGWVAFTSEKHDSIFFELEKFADTTKLTKLHLLTPNSIQSLNYLNSSFFPSQALP